MDDTAGFDDSKPKVSKNDVSAMFQKMGAKLGWFEFKDLDSALKTLSNSSKKKCTKSRRRKEHSEDNQDSKTDSDKPRRTKKKQMKSVNPEIKSKISFSSESPSPLKEIQNFNTGDNLLSDSDLEIPLRRTPASTDLTKNNIKLSTKENSLIPDKSRKSAIQSKSAKNRNGQYRVVRSHSSSPEDYDFGVPVQESTRIHSRASIDTFLDTSENTLNQLDTSKDNSYKQLDIHKLKNQESSGRFKKGQVQSNSDICSKLKILDLSDDAFENTASPNNDLYATAVLDKSRDLQPQLPLEKSRKSVYYDAKTDPEMSDELQQNLGKVEKSRKSVYFDAKTDPEMSGELQPNLVKVEKSRKSVYFDARTGESCSSESSFTELSPPCKSHVQTKVNSDEEDSDSQKPRQLSDDNDSSSFEVADISIQTEDNSSKPGHLVSSHRKRTVESSSTVSDDSDYVEINDVSLQTSTGNHSNTQSVSPLHTNNSENSEKNSDEENQLKGDNSTKSNYSCSDTTDSFVEVQDMSCQALSNNNSSPNVQGGQTVSEKHSNTCSPVFSDSEGDLDEIKVRPDCPEDEDDKYEGHIVQGVSSDKEESCHKDKRNNINSVIHSIISSEEDDSELDNVLILKQPSLKPTGRTQQISQLSIDDILSSDDDDRTVPTKVKGSETAAAKQVQVENKEPKWRKRNSYDSDSSEDEEQLESFFQNLRTKSQANEDKEEEELEHENSMEDFIVDDCDVSSSDYDSNEDEVLLRSEEICISSDDEFLTPARTRRQKDIQSIVLSSSTDDSDDELPDLKETKPRRTPMKTSKINKVLDRPTNIKTPSQTPVRDKPRNTVETNRQYSFLKSLGQDMPLERCAPDAARYVKHFAKTREELTMKLFKMFNESVFDKKLPTDLSITWNKRLLKTAGYCRYKKTRDSVKTASVELSVKVCDSAERTRDTLIHELCHAAVWLVNGVNDGHGPYWKYWAKKANCTHPELPVVSRCHSYKIETKFKYQCIDCKYEIGRHSKSLNTDRFICGKCRGKFILLDKSGKPVHGARNKDGSAKTPNKFALFVKENYKEVKNKDKSLNHAEVMSVLSKEFAKQKLS